MNLETPKAIGLTQVLKITFAVFLAFS